jgi:isopenicillin N synthase-like dioxygenase
VSEDLLDTAYGMLREFFSEPQESKQRFSAPGANGQTGYTGLLVETAAASDRPDWKEMLNWSTPIPAGHPLKRKFVTAYPDQVLPEEAVPGITKVLYEFHDTIADLQRRFLRHVWAAEHGDINLITALPRATAPGLQVKVDGEWVDAVAPERRVIVNTGIMLERLTNGAIPIGWHRVVAAPGYEGERYSVVQFCHPRPWTVLSPVPSCCTPDNPQRFSAITAADALDEVLYQINLVETARRV